MNNHSIHLEWRLMLDYTSLTIIIPLVKEHINTRKQTIVKNSDKEQKFIKDLSESLKKIDTSNIVDSLYLNRIINNFASMVENT